MRSVLAAAVLSVFASSLDAATLVVQPGGAFSTITDAEAAAQPGDTIIVKTGVYVENVIIDVANLTIKAKGKVVLDASLDGGGGPGGAGLLIPAVGVTIDGLTIRNARTLAADDGDGIRIIGSNAVIKNCTFIRSEVNGITVIGATNTTIDHCTFDGGNDAISLLNTTTTQITKCLVKRAGNAGLRLDGTTATVIEKSTIRYCEDDGAVDANETNNNTDVTVRSCTLELNDGAAVEFKGTNLTVDKCKVQNNSGPGVFASSSSNVVVKNSTFHDLVNDGEGILFATVNTGTIEKCSFHDLAGSGGSFTGGGAILVHKCTFKNGGSEDEAGLVFTGIANVQVDDTTISGFGDGIRLQTATNGTIDDCSISACRSDGVDINNAGATPVLITDCKITGCLSEGIDNSGSATQATNCKVTKNRIDIANDGTLTLTNVSFGTGGTLTAPQID